MASDPSHDFDRNLWAKGCYACGALSEADLEAPCPNPKDPKHAYARKAERRRTMNPDDAETGRPRMSAKRYPVVWHVEANRHPATDGQQWGWVDPQIMWHGEAGRREAQATADLLNAAQSGMVLDLSELPKQFDVRLTAHVVSGEREFYCEVRDLEDSIFQYWGGEGSTPAEAFHAALDAWRKR